MSNLDWVKQHLQEVIAAESEHPRAPASAQGAPAVEDAVLSPSPANGNAPGRVGEPAAAGGALPGAGAAVAVAEVLAKVVEAVEGAASDAVEPPSKRPRSTSAAAGAAAPPVAAPPAAAAAAAAAGGAEDLDSDSDADVPLMALARESSLAQSSPPGSGPGRRAGGAPAAAGAGPSAAGAGEAPAAALLRLRGLIPPALAAEYAAPHAAAPEAAAALDAALAALRAEVASVIRRREVQAKPDVRAISNLRARHPDWPCWPNAHGHAPGAALGRRFTGRAELAVAGIHHSYFAGIATAGAGAPATAIVVSGGYEDGADHGDWLVYTGQGGRCAASSRQVKDQEWSAGNAALRANMERGVPVRVARGARSEGGAAAAAASAAVGGKATPEYTYDGLYAVVAAERAPGEGGHLVCRFTLVGVPGHYRASRRVAYGDLKAPGPRAGRIVRRELAGAGAGGAAAFDPAAPRAAAVRAAAALRAPPQPAYAPDGGGARPGAGKARAPAKKADKAAARGAAAKRPRAAARAPPPPPPPRKRLVLADISGGVDDLPVPVYNEVDDEPPPLVRYLRTSTVPGAAARALADAAAAAMPASWCGLRQGAGAVGEGAAAYNADGLMVRTESLGWWECGPGCPARGAPASKSCRFNRHLCGGGLRAPVEVFRAGAAKGWGVRAGAALPAGTVVCCYEGEVITNAEAEARRGADGYLFDLDYFIDFHRLPDTTEAERAALPPLPPVAAFGLGERGGADDAHLVIDAGAAGNVGRFLNHGCAPNCVVQPVLLADRGAGRGEPPASALLYTVALVASRDVAAGEELCYDYKYRVGAGPGEPVACACGAPPPPRGWKEGDEVPEGCCRGRLL